MFSQAIRVLQAARGGEASVALSRWGPVVLEDFLTDREAAGLRRELLGSHADWFPMQTQGAQEESVAAYRDALASLVPASAPTQALGGEHGERASTTCEAVLSELGAFQDRLMLRKQEGWSVRGESISRWKGFRCMIATWGAADEGNESASEWSKHKALGPVPAGMPRLAALQASLLSVRFRSALASLVGLPVDAVEPLYLRIYRHSEPHHFTAPHTDQHTDIALDHDQANPRVVRTLASLAFNLGDHDTEADGSGGLVWCLPQPRRLPSPRGSALLFRVSNVSRHAVVPGYYGNGRGQRLTVQVVFGGVLPGGGSRPSVGSFPTDVPPADALPPATRPSAAQARCTDDNEAVADLTSAQLGQALRCVDLLREPGEAPRHCVEGEVLGRLCCARCAVLWADRGRFVQGLRPQLVRVQELLREANRRFRSPPLHPGTVVSDGAAAAVGEIRMPLCVLGTGKLQGRRAAEIIEYALRSGYRHLDSAMSYRSHGELLRRGVEGSGVPREDIFITTKVPTSSMGYHGASAIVERIAREIPGGYADLCLVHWPVSDGPSPPGGSSAHFDVVERAGTWRVLEAAFRARTCRAIGVSNFMVKHLEELAGYAWIQPAVNQIEYSPTAPLGELIDYCHRKGIVVEAFRWHAQHVMDLPQLQELSRSMARPAMHVLMRWFLAQGIAPIFGTNREERLLENAEAFATDQQLELTRAELSALRLPRDDYPWINYAGARSPWGMPAMDSFA